MTPHDWAAEEAAQAIASHAPKLAPGIEPDSTRLLLTVSEAAKELHLSRWAIYRLIHQNKLETIKLGSARRIPYGALLDCIAQLRQSGGTAL